MSSIGNAEVNFTDVHVVFPNPATDRIFINENTSGNFTLTNTLGRTVKDETLTPEMCTNGISIAELPACVYYYAIAGEEQYRGRIIVE